MTKSGLWQISTWATKMCFVQITRRSLTERVFPNPVTIIDCMAFQGQHWSVQYGTKHCLRYHQVHGWLYHQIVPKKHSYNLISAAYPSLSVLDYQNSSVSYLQPVVSFEVKGHGFSPTPTKCACVLLYSPSPVHLCMHILSVLPREHLCVHV